MTNRKKRVVLFQEEGSLPSIPTNLIDFVSWAQSLLDQVPHQSQGTALVEIESETAYDCDYPMITVSYSRLETSAETSARCEEEDRSQRRAESAELATLHRLQAKYGHLTTSERSEDSE